MFRFLLVLLIIPTLSLAQNNSNMDRPKLVVGIVVDQMRTDYIFRYWETFGDGGFKRLLGEGHFFSNTHYNYFPTYTAPGHASIFTGSTPSVHGIVGNYYYDPIKNETVYCVQDSRYLEVNEAKNRDENQDGSRLGGDMSPHRMYSTTITDQLKLAQAFKNKTIGVSLKDRGSVLPAGHFADAAYWMDKFGTRFISSDFYMEEYPKWVEKFTEDHPVESYLDTWDLLLPKRKYTSSLEDDSPFEARVKGEDAPVFPRDLKKLSALNGKGIIRATPFGNTILTDFAIATVKGEKLGQSTTSDFLTVSYSSPDYVGHSYGTLALETQDTYARLDRELERFFKFLDKEIGKGNYLVFLSADHAGADIPGIIKSKKGPADYFNSRDVFTKVGEVLDSLYSVPVVKEVSGQQIYLDKEVLVANGIDENAVLNTIRELLIPNAGISAVYFNDDFVGNRMNGFPSEIFQNGFHHQFAGDLTYVLKPGWIDYGFTGTTHGAPYAYDTHVPLIFMGWGVQQGETRERVEIIDIAPTVASMIRVAFPSGSWGKVLPQVIK